MTIPEIQQKMILYAADNLHEVCHLLKVWAYARTIGACEGLDERTQTVLEVAALLHDIACPLCRKKYGRAAGPDQEREGMPLAEAFLADCGLAAEDAARVVFLVGHHHTTLGVDGADWRILLEADYLVNADELSYDPAHIRAALNDLYRTETGKRLLRALYHLD